jgi:hypothetical protein
VTPDFERDPRSVGLADVDGLAVLEVDHLHPLAIKEDPVQRIVVNRDPPAVIEAKQQVGARDQRMRHAQVGAHIAADDHVASRREVAFRSGGPNRQHWRRGLIHRRVSRFLDRRSLRVGQCRFSRIFHHTMVL